MQQKEEKQFCVSLNQHQGLNSVPTIRKTSPPTKAAVINIVVSAEHSNSSDAYLCLLYIVYYPLLNETFPAGKILSQQLYLYHSFILESFAWLIHIHLSSLPPKSLLL